MNKSKHCIHPETQAFIIHYLIAENLHGVICCFQNPRKNTCPVFKDVCRK